MGASTRYLQQRYSMPQAQVKGALTDIGISVLIKVSYSHMNMNKKRDTPFRASLFFQSDSKTQSLRRIHHSKKLSSQGKANSEIP